MTITQRIESTLMDPETGLYAVQQPFHNEWHAMADAYARVLIATPRGHGVTMQMLYRILHERNEHPEAKIVYLTATKEKAQDFKGMLEAMGDRSFEYGLPIKRVSPATQCYGILQTSAGSRIDILVVESPIDLLNSATAEKRKEIIDAFTMCWLPMLAPSGQVIVAGTPYHKKDLISLLSKSWATWWKPAIPCLWPEKWTPELLERRRQDMGDRAFRRMFMLDLPEGDTGEDCQHIHVTLGRCANCKVTNVRSFVESQGSISP